MKKNKKERTEQIYVVVSSLINQFNILDKIVYT